MNRIILLVLSSLIFIACAKQNGSDSGSKSIPSDHLGDWKYQDEKMSADMNISKKLISLSIKPSNFGEIKSNMKIDSIVGDSVYGIVNAMGIERPSAWYYGEKEGGLQVGQQIFTR